MERDDGGTRKELYRVAFRTAERIILLSPFSFLAYLLNSSAAFGVLSGMSGVMRALVRIC